MIPNTNADPYSKGEVTSTNQALLLKTLLNKYSYLSNTKRLVANQ
jgi:hypothetical protein